MAYLRTVATEFQKAINDARSVSDLQAIMHKYYAQNVRQSEAGQPVKEGFQAVYDAETGFFNYLEKGHFDSNALHSLAVEGNRVFADVTITFVLKGNATPIVQHQLVEQEWKDGKIVFERFWHEKH